MWGEGGGRMQRRPALLQPPLGGLTQGRADQQDHPPRGGQGDEKSATSSIIATCNNQPPPRCRVKKPPWVVPILTKPSQARWAIRAVPILIKLSRTQWAVPRLLPNQGRNNGDVDISDNNICDIVATNVLAGDRYPARDYGLGRDAHPTTLIGMLEKWEGKRILFVIFLIVNFSFSFLILVIIKKL
jgi:hypothetical protein